MTSHANTSERAAPVSALRALDYWAIAGIMGLMGAFFWAIRGTSGYGGAQGGLLAGLGWAILWYLFSTLDGQARLRPYGHARMIAAITFGIAFGGMTGYGVYIAWLQGKFYLNYPDGVRAIAPWTGYAMLFLCGLHWGGVAGAFMAWCAPRAPLGWRGWAARIGAGILGAIIAGIIVRVFPQYFLPFYHEGLYDVAENATCRRAVGSIRNIAPHIGLFLGFLTFEAARRDRRAVAMMLVMALGFAIPFTIGGYWQTMHGSAWKLDWWKNWEMSIGLGGGLAFGLAFYLFNRPEGAAPQPVTVKECIWGAGLTIWFASFTIFRNAYIGFTKIHALEWPGWISIVLSLLFLIPATIAYIRYIQRVSKNPGTMPLSWRVCFLVLLLIVAAGFTVSIHAESLPWNRLLIALYTGYIGVSAALWLLLARGVRNPSGVVQ